MAKRRHESASTGNLMGSILAAQMGLCVVLAALFWGMDGYVSGYSALLGGLT
jgi:F0F1-type ATP synthase assembly protein I